MTPEQRIDWDRLINACRWGKEQGKSTIIAGLDLLIAVADRLTRLEAGIEDLARGCNVPDRPADRPE